MVTGDVDILKELLGSVYLTERQKQALGRVMGVVLEQVQLDARQLRAVADDRQMPMYVRANAEQALHHLQSAVEEDRRHALLGPCGAE